MHRDAECERGSGTVLVVAAIMVIVTALLVVATLGSGYRARHQAATAADLAALAAADALLASDRDPCATAERVSRANGARMQECVVNGWEVEVVAEAAAAIPSRWMARPARRARAGVEPPGTGQSISAGVDGWAVPITSGYQLTARFGDTGPRWASGRHTGLDFAAPTGTSVVASAPGRVTQAGRAGAYGNLVVIDHGTAMTYYAHLSAVSVASGDEVRAGQRIGAVGATGNVTGPHLHLEVRIDGVPQDPESVLSGTG